MVGDGGFVALVWKRGWRRGLERDKEEVRRAMERMKGVESEGGGEEGTGRTVQRLDVFWDSRAEEDPVAPRDRGKEMRLDQ